VRLHIFYQTLADNAKSSEPMNAHAATTHVNTVYHTVQSRHTTRREIKKYFNVAKKIALDSTASYAISALSTHMGMLAPYQIMMQTILSSMDIVVDKKERGIVDVFVKFPIVIMTSCIDVANDDITTGMQDALHLEGNEVIHSIIQMILFFLSTTAVLF
jgi:hypothetical protein